MKPYISGYKVRVVGKVMEAWSSLFSIWYLKHKFMTFRFSTSISNFAERVQGKHGVYEWSFKNSLYNSTAFIGLYHEGDVLRLLIHRGPRLAFWCGGDCLWLQKHPFWQWLIRRVKCDHVCENEVEQEALRKMGIEARIHPILFFDDYKKYPLSFKPSEKPHVWLTCHPGREREYGVELVEEIADQVPEVTFHIFGINKPFHEVWFDRINGEVHNTRQATQKNIIYHGQIPSEELDVMIRDYHAGLRTCAFDGCPHTVTKGALLGQYPINFIPYPHTWNYKTKEELIKLLNKLKTIKEPNVVGREYWLRTVSEYPWQ